MSITALTITCLAAQALVIGLLRTSLRNVERRVTAARIVSLAVFIGLEAAMFAHLILSHSTETATPRDIVIDISLAVSIALAYSFAGSLLNRLRHSGRQIQRISDFNAMLFDQSSEPIIHFDASGKLLDVNPAACELIGFSKEKLFELSMADLVHPDDLSAVGAQLRQTAPGEAVRFSFRVRQANGAILFAESATRRLEDRTFLIIARNITEQTAERRTLERFAESSSLAGQRFFASVVEGIADLLACNHVLVGELMSGANGRIRTLALAIDGKLVSNVEYDLAGAPCATVVGKSPVCYPTNLQKLFPEDHLLVEIGAVAYVGAPLFASDGRSLGLICALSRYPITDQRHCQTVLACYSNRVASEIERMQADAALRVSEERYANIVKVSPFGMHFYRLESDDRLVLEAANPAADWLLGIDHSKLVGKSIEEAFPNLAGSEIPGQYRRVAAHGERWRTESVTFQDDRINGAFEVTAYQLSPMRMTAVFANIADRKKAEDALRTSEERYRNFVDNATEGIYRVEFTEPISVDDPIHVIAERINCCAIGAEMNQAFAEMYHTTPEAMVGRPVRDFAPEWATFAAHLAKSKDFRIVGHESHERAADGTPITVIENFFGVVEDRKLLRIWGVQQNITERKRMEATLRKRHEQFLTFASLVPGVLYQLKRHADGAYSMPFASDAIEAIFGCTFEHAHSNIDFITSVLFQPDLPMVLKSLDASARDLSTWRCEFRVQVPGRPIRWMLGQSLPERLADGGTMWHGFITDITERKQAEQDLQRSLSLLRATLDSTADGILVVDNDGKVAGYNQRFLEHWRIPVTLAAQNDDARLIAFVLDQLKDPDGFLRKVKELYENLGAESFDLLEFRDGRYFERYSLPQRVGSEIVGRVWSFRDVTDRKRAEIDRSKLEAQLRLSQKLETIGTLAAGIAHDFNNLLVPVIGYTELADSELDSDHEAHEHLAEVLKAAYRAKSLVGQLLTFSRQQSGETRLVRLESIVEEASCLLRSTLDPNISLETRYEDNLPRLFADATQLHQVIMNLGVNASHAMKLGGKLAMSVSALKVDVTNCSICGFQLFGRHLELRVTDTGHGMDQPTMRRIFDPFFTTKPVGEGTGLGLAVSHGIIAHHGGHICVQSEVGRGTSFYVYLPSTDDSDSAPNSLRRAGIVAGNPIPISR